MKIRDVLIAKGSQVETVFPSRPLNKVLKLFDERHIASVVVVDTDRKPLGIVTDRRVIELLARKGEAAFHLTATDAMLTPLPVVSPAAGVQEALRHMTTDRVRHLVVMDGDRMIGLISIGDLVKWRLKDAELESKVLRDMALTRMAAE
jgi:CBS domain-containing protein